MFSGLSLYETELNYQNNRKIHFTLLILGN